MRENEIPALCRDYSLANQTIMSTQSEDVCAFIYLSNSHGYTFGDHCRNAPAPMSIWCHEHHMSENATEKRLDLQEEHLNKNLISAESKEEKKHCMFICQKEHLNENLISAESKEEKKHCMFICQRECKTGSFGHFCTAQRQDPLFCSTHHKQHGTNPQKVTEWLDQINKVFHISAGAMRGIAMHAVTPDTVEELRRIIKGDDEDEVKCAVKCEVKCATEPHEEEKTTQHCMFLCRRECSSGHAGCFCTGIRKNGSIFCLMHHKAKGKIVDAYFQELSDTFNI